MNFEKYYFGPSRFLTKRISLQTKLNKSSDFTIQGGNQSQPILISSVVWNSPAYRKGLRPGDQILSINGISFENINYTQALQIIYSFDDLDLVIRQIRLHDLDGTLYDWYDPISQRSTSPPPSTYLSLNAHLPFQQKAIQMNMEKGKRLGLVIRGGSEYGLGIFISSVENYSLSHQYGISIGDQILSVNNIDFLHISHHDAVSILRNSSQLNIHLRQMNKLPKPKHASNPSTRKENSNFNPMIDLISIENNQLKFQEIFNGYLRQTSSIEPVFNSLLKILNQQNQSNRNQIFDLLKKSIHRKDLDRLELLILKDDFNILKLSHQRLMEESLSPLKLKTNHMSKSLENLSMKNEEKLVRPQSLSIRENLSSDDDYQYNSLRKTKSLHNVDEDHSKSNLNEEQSSVFDQFLQDYSSPYPITIHKVRSTLGIAIEGGFQDRIPLPRIVYMQPDGSAYISSGLRVGHVVLSVNGHSMKGLPHKEAALLLASAFKDKNTSQMNLVVVQPMK